MFRRDQTAGSLKPAGLTRRLTKNRRDQPAGSPASWVGKSSGFTVESLAGDTPEDREYAGVLPAERRGGLSALHSQSGR